MMVNNDFRPTKITFWSPYPSTRHRPWRKMVKKNEFRQAKLRLSLRLSQTLPNSLTDSLRLSQTLSDSLRLSFSESLSESFYSEALSQTLFQTLSQTLSLRLSLPKKLCPQCVLHDAEKVNQFQLRTWSWIVEQIMNLRRLYLTPVCAKYWRAFEHGFLIGCGHFFTTAARKSRITEKCLSMLRNNMCGDTV